MTKPKLAIVGATGAVGSVMIELINERQKNNFINNLLFIITLKN